MPARSAIDQLPVELRQWLQSTLEARGFAHYTELAAELNEKLAELGLRVSRSAVHRFGQDVEARLSKMRDTTELAKLVVNQIPDAEGAMNDALVRLVQHTLFEFIAANPEMDVKDSTKLAHAIADLAKASVTQKRFMETVRAKAEAAEKAITEKVTQAGLSPDAVQAIRKQILGIAA